VPRPAAKRPPLIISLAAWLCAAAAFAQAPAPAPALMGWPDLLGRPLPAPTERVAYGRDPLQVADLWLPQGRGPHPLVVMVHGGCWRTSVARASIMNYLAEDLRAHGVAVWNLEYRGVDRPGGGYPGTFADLADGADAVRRLARPRHLDLTHVVAVGHSAGGHLALWLAARDGLPRASPLRRDHPLAFAAAFSLGGLPDLEAAMTPGTDTCGAAQVAALVGEATPAHPAVFADTSPAVMPPPRARVILVNADRDPIAPPAFASAYAARMAARGPAPRTVLVENAGHVELIAPGTAAWDRERALILEAVAVRP
jgi:acetyl esterase/lipase